MGKGWSTACHALVPIAGQPGGAPEHASLGRVRSVSGGNAVLVRRTGDRSAKAAPWVPLSKRIKRWLGVDGNPLRRPVDRFESAVRVALVLAFLIGAPMLAPATRHLVEVAGLQEVHREASWRQVQAVLVRSAPRQFYAYGSMATFWVPGRWQAPSGGMRNGLVPAKTGDPAGGRVRVWVNWAGQVMNRHPMTIGMVKVRSVLLEIGTVVALALVLLLLAGLTRICLNRRRMLHWGIEWACFGPRWSTRRWPRN
jgi:hypothetical protein